MSERFSAESHVRLYWAVGAVLFALTTATVLVSRADLAEPWGLIVGVTIAVLKASLVAAVYMHLKWESRVIYYVVAACAFLAFFLGAFAVGDLYRTTGHIIARWP